MSRQHESEYVIIKPVSKRLLLRRWATVDKICCRPWVGFISLLLGSRLKWFGPNWPERDIKAELTAHLSFREENLGHLSGGSPVSETVEGGKRNQKLEVILLVKNEIGFLKTLRGIAERMAHHTNLRHSVHWCGLFIFFWIIYETERRRPVS